MEMISNMNGTHYDELIVGTAVPVLTKNVTLKGVTASYKRGTLLALVNGKYEIVDSTASTGAEKASAVRRRRPAASRSRPFSPNDARRNLRPPR